jgi:glutamate-1-semialdehyde aminotransferase
MPHTDALHPADPPIAASDALYARAVALIPGATQTLAKGPGQYVKGVAPKYLRRGQGARVWDVDGNEYLDLTMAVGPLVLGYGHPAVDGAIRAQLQDGIVFSQMHPLEVEVAERLCSLIPGAEMVRFGKTGAEVTSAAVRLARAYTGRRKVLCCGYHGWHDWYIGVTDRGRGVPEEVRDLTFTFGYNDLGSVRDAIDDDTACVILEPMTFEEPRDGFLGELRRLCDERGAVLVFDEMWTGFRLALGGAQSRFGVRADLACFSKAVANGMPLSVLSGRRELMQLLDREVFFYSTFGGEALSLAAARATLDVLVEEDVPAQLETRGRQLRDRLNALAAELGLPWLRCIGPGCRTLVTFGPEAGNPLIVKSLVQQELVRRGVLWTGFHNLALAHGEAEIEYLLAAYRDALPVVGEAVARGEQRAALRGAPVEPVFRRTGGFHMKPRARAAAR